MLGFLERLKQWLSHSTEIDETQNQVSESQSTKLENNQITTHGQAEIIEQSILETANSTSIEKLEKIEPLINIPTYQSSHKTLQDQLNELQANATLSLWPPNGEYTGPIIINNPIVLDGKGGTIWAIQGPVFSILSDQVSLCNLRIEVTGEMEIGNSENNCAILVKSEKNLNLEINFENIEVRGSVMGLSEEEGEWQYPSTLNIGRIAHGQEYNFRWRLIVPVDCKIVSEISGIEFNPHKLNPGANEINIQVEKLPQDTLVNGSIYLVSANFKRRIAITAHIVSLSDQDTLTIDNDVIWEAETWATFSQSAIKENVINIPEKTTQVEQIPIEQEVVINQTCEKLEPLPKPDSIHTENNNEVASKSRTYREVKPHKIFESESQKLNKQQSQIENSDSSTKSASVNPLFQTVKNNYSEIENDHLPASSQESSSSVINPIFQKNSPFSQPINPNQVSEKSSSQKSDSQTNSPAKKRTQARPNNIFLDGVNKKDPQE